MRLCARSLSLLDLHAKSREHGSYGWARTNLSSHCGTATGSGFGTGSRSHTITQVRLSKIDDYLVDNVFVIDYRIWVMRSTIKRGCGVEAFGNSPGSSSTQVCVQRTSKERTRTWGSGPPEQKEAAGESARLLRDLEGGAAAVLAELAGGAEQVAFVVHDYTVKRLEAATLGREVIHDPVLPLATLLRR